MKKILLLLGVLAFGASVFAQVVAVTENGDSISVYANGKWKRYSSSGEYEGVISTVKAWVEIDSTNMSKTVLTKPWQRFAMTSNNQPLIAHVAIADTMTMFAVIYTGSVGCLEQYRSVMTVTLASGKKVECAQVSETNCKDDATVMFVAVPRKAVQTNKFLEAQDAGLALLRKSDWTNIRIQGSEDFVDLKPKKSAREPYPEQFFRQHLESAENK